MDENAVIGQWVNDQISDDDLLVKAKTLLDTHGAAFTVSAEMLGGLVALCEERQQEIERLRREDVVFREDQLTDLHTWARRMEAWARHRNKRLGVGRVISIGSRRALVFVRERT